MPRASTKNASIPDRHEATTTSESVSRSEHENVTAPDCGTSNPVELVKKLMDLADDDGAFAYG